MKFEFYVPNYNCNKHKVEMFNIFDNINVQEHAKSAVKKYLRSPKNFKYVRTYSNPKYDIKEEAYYGFEAFVMEIDSIIRWQEWSRREYETNISDAFTYEICDLVNEFDKYTNLEDLKEYLDKN